MTRLVECVPNCSDGRNQHVIDAIAQAISSVSGVKLLDVDPGADTNRTVYTFVGEPDAVQEAAVKAAHAAAEHIDMRVHQGAHPRIGAMDVCPFVPVAGVTMAECVDMAHAVGRRIAEDLRVPVYFYEHAASSDARRSLATIRAGEYEGLAQKLRDPAWQPDCGPVRFEARYGATVVGARDFLLAYNVNLNTRDRRLAHEIALTIREAGRAQRDASGQIVRGTDGQPKRVAGRLRRVRAIGWYIEEYRQAQVSINLLDYKTTALHTVFEVVCEEAAKLGLRVSGSELVGMTPREPIVEAGRYYLRRQGKSTGVALAELVEIAIRSLGLDQIAPFDVNKKIIEAYFEPEAPLLSMAVARFVDEVASEAPAPGGGSVAALAGSLGAALAALVANVTVGRSGFEAASAALCADAERAQELKARLATLVDEDTRAFMDVVAARRLPKGTATDESARAGAIEAALQRAAQVPRETMQLSLEVLRLAGSIVERGNPHAASDAGVAGLMARAGVEGATLNVLINLASIQDETFTRECRDEIAHVRAEAARLVEALTRALERRGVM
ncbi:MAG: glutamate formimidoyltransferase [Luteitalea sp.]|nr:glutamate formimidoyltransferase [Luteitalea sp.]